MCVYFHLYQIANHLFFEKFSAEYIGWFTNVGTFSGLSSPLSMVCSGAKITYKGANTHTYKSTWPRVNRQKTTGKNYSYVTMRIKSTWKFSCWYFFLVCWHENIFMSIYKDGWILMFFFFIIYIGLCWFTLIYLDLPWKWTWINVNRRKPTGKNSLWEIIPYENFLVDFFFKHVDMGIFSRHIPKID